VRPEARLVAFMCLVYFDYLVEPDEADKPDTRQTTNDKDRTRWASRGAELLGNNSLPPLLVV
jgi:hypothetical protein